MIEITYKIRSENYVFYIHFLKSSPKVSDFKNEMGEAFEGIFHCTEVERFTSGFLNLHEQR